MLIAVLIASVVLNVALLAFAGFQHCVITACAGALVKPL